MLTKKITLHAWAAARYDPPPSAWVLRKWVREGEIQPPPEKVGRDYYVDESAERRTAKLPSLVSRLKAA